MFAAASVKFSSVVPIEVFPLIPGSVVWERPAAVKGAPGRARRSAPLTARTVPRESEERGKTVTDQPGNNLTRTPRISRPVTATERYGDGGTIVLDSWRMELTRTVSPQL